MAEGCGYQICVCHICKFGFSKKKGIMIKFRLDQKGFTIIELLIVFIIVGTLAVLGFVAYSDAQKKATRSMVESTLGQVKSKLSDYYTTNNEYPADKAALKTYLESDEAGSEDTLSAAIGPATGADSNKYVYDCDPEGCDVGFTLTADDTLWGAKPVGDITVKN